MLMTPENPKSDNQIALVRQMINNFRKAIKLNGINKITGLSTMGAHHKSGTGNLYASHLLENAFSDCQIEKTFVRPAYFTAIGLGILNWHKRKTFCLPFFRLS